MVYVPSQHLSWTGSLSSRAHARACLPTDTLTRTPSYFVHVVMITSDAPFFHLSFYSRWCWDTEAHIQNVTEYFISSGLAKLGYVRINIDEGWLKGRDNVTGTCDTSNASHTFIPV